MKKKYNIIEKANQRKTAPVEIIDVNTGEIIQTTLEKAAYTLGYSVVKTAALCRWADKAKEVVEQGYYIRWKKREKKQVKKDEAEDKVTIQVQHNFF